MRVPAKPEDIIEAYIDESSQNKHRFLVLGAVIFRMTSAQKFNDLIGTARLPELPQGEAKWTKVSKAKLAAYKRLVDVLFDNPEENPLSFAVCRYHAAGSQELQRRR